MTSAIQGLQDIVLDGPVAVAAVLAVAAGVVSFFSPCCLPLVPGYLSYAAGLAGEDLLAGERGPAPSTASTSVKTRTRARRRATWGAALFVSGFSAVFVGYGALFGSLGAALATHQETIIRVMGVVTIALGLLFTGALWRVPGAMRSFRPRFRPRAGLAGAPLVGMVFGIGWTPCIGPTLAAVLTLATSSADAGRGAVLSLAYSVGLGIPFVLAAASLERFMASTQWARHHARLVTRIGGGMLIVLGIVQASGLWTVLMSHLQGVIVGWQPPI
ncbi:cytochrome c biogenesis protein CcdA [Nocardioides panacisoli]|uniref:cytochrome c biogenesis CcdA family protein n=1 Tax=Nocardioides panacisoli TaxID=627624 RepID=UPI001C63AE64|nr:cytochrome c biogenesis protein CcdA [Nocardioides panacisoli]QYJ05420.1 cytochrome c biogenesis protein CcdA [Nocardioides panacisoli]